MKIGGEGWALAFASSKLSLMYGFIGIEQGLYCSDRVQRVVIYLITWMSSIAMYGYNISTCNENDVCNY